MDTSSREEHHTKNISLPFQNMRLVFLGLGIIIPSLFLGALFGGNFFSSGGTHNTAAGAAPNPTVSAVEVAEITNSTAVIRWETKGAGDAQVDYGSSASYGFTSLLDARPGTKHEVFLTNLEPGFEYHFQARSKDPIGHLAVSGDLIFTTLPSVRGQVSICGWDGDSIERTDTFCSAKDGWAKGESWTDSCSAVWSQTTSSPVTECTYEFSDAKSRGSVKLNESWNVTLEPDYTGWVDVLVVSDPAGAETFLPAAVLAVNGSVIMDALDTAGKYSFRFRPADDSASWGDVLTITVRK